VGLYIFRGDGEGMCNSSFIVWVWNLLYDMMVWDCGVLESQGLGRVYSRVDDSLCACTISISLFVVLFVNDFRNEVCFVFL
jgi:hypothetical protein